MNETGAYTEAYLEPFKQRLETLKKIIKQDSDDGKHPEPIVRLMLKKVEGVGTLFVYLLSSTYDRTSTSRFVRIIISNIHRARAYTSTLSCIEEAACRVVGRAKVE